jgi:uncharacterized protein
VSEDWGPFEIAGSAVAPGESRDLRLRVTETYIAEPVSIPLTVVRGAEPGPTVFVTSSVHGDELNGVGVVRDLLSDHAGGIRAGTLIAVPVVNVPGFLRLERRLPDGRDLNRNFPGNPKGSLTSRLAHAIFEQVVAVSDFGIDLHTGGGGRANYPHIRADLTRPPVRDLAHAFGAPLLLDDPGPDRSLRRTATERGIPTVVFEAGIARRFERHFIEEGLRGVLAALAHLGLTDFPATSRTSVPITESRWLRARAGGILDLRVALGQPIGRGDLISVNTNPFGHERTALDAPFSGVVLGLTSVPLVHPGDPVCHLARVGPEDFRKWWDRWHEITDDKGLKSFAHEALRPDASRPLQPSDRVL